jgi:hypothetical protein
MQLLCFILLACGASTDVVLDECACPRNEEIGTDAMEHFLDPFVACTVRASQNGGHTWRRCSNEDAAAYDGNKSLYLVFVGRVVFLSILDCF